MRGDATFPVRLRSTKRGRIRFISHRDVARAFERAFRVARLPLAFTGGFSPRPRISFGLALPVGAESDAEYLDLELADEIDLDALVASVAVALPEGIDITGAVVLADRARSLQESVTSTTWRVDLPGGDADVLGDAVRTVLAASSLPAVRIRKGVETTDDLRPAIADLRVVDAGPVGTALEMELTTGARSVRPGEVVAVIDGAPAPSRLLRTHQWIERDGARYEPLVADARPRAVEARA